jgi:hypothetical protein
MATSLIQEEIEITVGQRVTSQAFGDGTVAEINGDVITVHFDDGEKRKLKGEYLLTGTEIVALTKFEGESCTDSVQNPDVDTVIDEIKAKLQTCYTRGREWRLEMGKLLYLLAVKCKESKLREWTHIVTEELGLRRQTAYDYRNEYMEENGIALEPEQREDVPNPKAEQVAAAVAAEQAQRDGRDVVDASTCKAPTPTLESLYVKVTLPKLKVSSDQKARYLELKRADPMRMYSMFKDLFESLVGPPLEQAVEEETVNADAIA